MKPLFKKAGSLSRNVVLFMVTVMLYGIAVEGISAVLLNLYLVRLGYGTEFIGTLNSAGMIVFALVSLPLGAVERYSGRRMMQFGQVDIVLRAARPSAFLSCNIWTGGAFDSISYCGNDWLVSLFCTSTAFAMEITQPSWHSRVLAWTMAAFSLSAFFGSWIGGNLPDFFGRILALPLTDPRPYQTALLAASFVMMPAMLAIWLIREEEIGDVREIRPN